MRIILLVFFTVLYSGLFAQVKNNQMETSSDSTMFLMTKPNPPLGNVREFVTASEAADTLANYMSFENIYTVDGTLTGTRSLSLAGYDLTFLQSGIGDVVFYGNNSVWTNYTNSHQAKIGAYNSGTFVGSESASPVEFIIGNTAQAIIESDGDAYYYNDLGVGISPAYALDVVGEFRLNNATEGIDRVLRSDANGLASWVDLGTLGGGTDDQTLQEVLTSGNDAGGLDAINFAEVEAEEFIGDLRGAVLFKAQAGETLAKGDVVYVSGISGNTTIVSKADADDANKMPAFGVVAAAASSPNPVDIYTFGTLSNLNTSAFGLGDILYVSTTAGQLTASPPTGESALIQNIAKVTRVDNSAGSIKISGAGRTNATPNLNTGRLFVGNASNQAVADGTIYVDIANSRVGIGTSSPYRKLSVEDGSIRISETAAVDGSVIGALEFYSTAGSEAQTHAKIEGYRVDAANGELLFYTKNTGGHYERMRIDENGNVGIGTSSADKTLVVSDAGSEIVINDTDDTPVLRFRNSGATSGTVQMTSGQDMMFLTGGTSEAMRITSGGNLGIGLNNPDRMLEITNTGGAYEAALEINSNSDAANWARLDLTNVNAPTGGFIFYQDNDGKAGIRNLSTDRITYVVDNSSAFHAWEIGSGTERMRLNSTGLGIGTNSPSAKLEVKGGYSRFTPASDAAWILDLRNFSNNQIGKFISNSSGNGAFSIFTNAGSENVVINSFGSSYFNGGNVGIGLTNPSQKLEVAGNIHTDNSGTGRSIRAYNASGKYSEINGTGLFSGENMSIYASGTGTRSMYQGLPSAEWLNIVHYLSTGGTESWRFNNVLEVQITESGLDLTTVPTENTDNILTYGSTGIISKTTKASIIADAGYWDRTGTTITEANAGDDLNFDSNTLFVDASANRVGIGITSPLERFVVSGGNMQLRGTTYTDFSDYWGSSNNSAIFTPYGFLGSSGSFATSLYSNGYRNNTAGFTYIGTGGNTSTASGIDLMPTGDIYFRNGTASGTVLPVRMTIKNGGNTGIGTSSPIGNLTVKAENRVITIGDSGRNNYAMLKATNTTGTGAAYLIQDTYATLFEQSGTLAYYMKPLHGGFSIYDTDGFTENIRLSATGDSYILNDDFGIGTSSPSKQLTIQSTGNAESLIETTIDALAATTLKNADAQWRIGVESFDDGLIFRQQDAGYTVGEALKLGADLDVRVYNNLRVDAMTQDDTESQVVVWDSGTNNLRWRDVSTLGDGDGIYDGSGSLSSSTTVTINGYGIDFVGSTDEFSINSFGQTSWTEGSNSSSIFQSGTGFYIQNATSLGSIHLRTGNPSPSTALYVKYDGNIGIGTLNPDKLLVVEGVNSEIVINDTSNAPELRFRNSGITSGSITMTSNQHMRFLTGGTSEQMRITDAGLVGINITSPNAYLDVGGRIESTSHIVAGVGSGGVAMTINDGKGNANLTFNHTAGIPEQAGAAARIEVNTDATTNAYMYFELKENNATSSINLVNALTLFQDDAVSTTSAYAAVNDNTPNHPFTVAWDGSEYFRVETDGDLSLAHNGGGTVSIGHISPDATKVLDVEGDSEFNGDVEWEDGALGTAGNGTNGGASSGESLVTFAAADVTTDGEITFSDANDEFTATNAGKYRISYTMQISGSGSNVCEGYVKIANTEQAAKYPRIYSGSTPGTLYAYSSSFTVDLTAGQTIDLYVNAATSTCTCSHAYLEVERLIGY